MVDSVVNVERHSDFEDSCRQWFIKCYYAPHLGNLEEEKGSFWNELFHLVSYIPQNKKVVVAGNMNGHVGSSNVGYDGTHVQLVLLKVSLNILLSGRRTNERFVILRSFQIKNVYQSINC